MSQSGSVLDKIVETKRAEIEAAKQRVSEESLRERLADAFPTRDFFGALAAVPATPQPENSEPKFHHQYHHHHHHHNQ